MNLLLLLCIHLPLRIILLCITSKHYVLHGSMQGNSGERICFYVYVYAYVHRGHFQSLRHDPSIVFSNTMHRIEISQQNKRTRSCDIANRCEI